MNKENFSNYKPYFVDPNRYVKIENRFRRKNIKIEYREKESKKNYDRILQSFRGKTEILSPRR